MLSVLAQSLIESLFMLLIFKAMTAAFYGRHFTQFSEI